MKSGLITGTLLLLLIPVLLTSSCGEDQYNDPGYIVEFAIDNLSHDNLLVIHRVSGSVVTDTNFIGRRSRLSFHIEKGSEISTREYFDNLTTLPFDLLEITDEYGYVLGFDELDIEAWEKLTMYGTARVQLTIQVDDIINK